MSLAELAAFPKQKRPSVIIDYHTGVRYSPEEAEGIPELSGPLRRLRERERQLNEPET